MSIFNACRLSRNGLVGEFTDSGGTEACLSLIVVVLTRVNAFRRRKDGTCPCTHMKPTLVLWLSLAAFTGFGPGRLAQAAGFDFAAPIVTAAEASGAEQLAAQEVRRYLYLRTGHLLSVRPAGEKLTGAEAAIVVANQDSPLVNALLATPGVPATARSPLGPEEFWLRTLKIGRREVWLIAGGSDTATLYGAYRFAELLGVRFYLHGDVVPDARLAGGVPAMDEQSSPLFAVRGIQPFHDFPEGPDWWNTDDYRAIIGQLPKLRMNFIGLHTYPEGGPHAEPTVWIGPAGEFRADGRVTASYPASYNNTIRAQAIPGNWGYAAKYTGAYAFGAAQLFDRDAFGPDCMLNRFPQPTQRGDCNAVFNATGELLRTAFTLAHRLGVKTCVGTETPLTVPKALQDRLRAAGKDPGGLAVRRELYEGMFRRIAAAYPLDYYWFWTPEGWTWEGTKDEQVQRTLDDLNAAIAALAAVKPPFRLATCGWVLGPQQDRALFDKVLPKDMPVSCINREVGKTPVDRAFSDVHGRSKWAIPWLEDDPALTSLQLWAGRMRRDAADARRYGCDGLLGIHWRTRSLGPNIAALAQAAWNQDAWNQAPFAPEPAKARTPGATGGAVAAFTNPIADTEDDPLYQTVRYNMSAYGFPLANGTYRVTLKFCEPHYTAAGKRVFGVKLQGRPVIENLDVFARVGQNRALDFTFDDIAVTNGWLDLDFVPVIEFPSIAAIDVEGPAGQVRINCGGPQYRDYAADTSVSAAPAQKYPPVDDFYRDWAEHEFGPEIGEAAGRLFAKLDGRLPRPSDWTDGPGGLRPDPRPWVQVQAEYVFAPQFAELRSKVRGAGNQARFDYWLATFRYLRAMAQVNCVWAQYNAAFAEARQAGDPATARRLAEDRALPLRRELVGAVADVYANLLATVSNPGELGTVMNWEQHILPGLLTKPGGELAGLLGHELAADAQPAATYHGPMRVIVPTVRSSYEPAEALTLKVLVLSGQPPREAVLKWRKLGGRAFATVPLQPVARGVYAAQFPAEATAAADFEYFVEVQPVSGAPVRFPATAPALNQTLVRLPVNW